MLGGEGGGGCTETTQKREMKRVPRKMLMYFGAMPLTSEGLVLGYYSVSQHSPFENGKDLSSSVWVFIGGGVFGGRLPGSNLVPNSSEDEARPSEELGGAAVEFCDYVGHVPFDVAPDLGVRARYKDWCQRSESAHYRQREELVSACEVVLREAAKVLVCGQWSWGRRGGEGRESTGMLTAMEEKSPIITFRPVKTE